MNNARRASAASQESWGGPATQRRAQSPSSEHPAPLFQHLLDRTQSRKIPADKLLLLARWLDTEPEIPEGEWYKRFSGMTVCGDGELIKTFPLPDQHPNGKPVK